MLKIALSRIVELAQLVEGFKLEPSEAKLSEISKELVSSKGKAQSMGRYIMRMQPLSPPTRHTR
jgi:hypothetical protein